MGVGGGGHSGHLSRHPTRTIGQDFISKFEESANMKEEAQEAGPPPAPSLSTPSFTGPFFSLLLPLPLLFYFINISFQPFRPAEGSR